jgi:hypothetical protein
MMFEHLQNLFRLRNYMNGFSQLFQLCCHIAQGHIPHQIAHLLGAPSLLTLTKPSSEMSHCYSADMILIHKPHFMPLILWCFCNTSPPSLIQNNNQGWMWSGNMWHKMHLDLSFQLDYFLVGHGDVKRGHILRTLCNKWGHHITHPFYLGLFEIIFFN